MKKVGNNPTFLVYIYCKLYVDKNAWGGGILEIRIGDINMDKDLGFLEESDKNIDDIELTEEDRKIYITDENGEKKEYEVLSYITIEDGDFVVYTDNKQLNNGQILIYVNSIIEENGETIFDEVDDEELVKVIEELKERLE